MYFVVHVDDGVEDQAERPELDLHPVAVRLVDGAALAVAHVPGDVLDNGEDLGVQRHLRRLILVR